MRKELYKKDYYNYNYLFKSELYDQLLNEIREKSLVNYILNLTYESKHLNEDFYTLKKVYKNDYKRFSKYRYIDNQFIKENSDKLSWYNISRFQKIDIEIIKEFKDKIIWEFYLYNNTVNEDVLNYICENMEECMNWNVISYTQKLSENFMEKYKDRLNFKYLSVHQKLSNEFILKYYDRLDLNEILIEQIDLSEELINKIERDLGIRYSFFNEIKECIKYLLFS